MSLLSDIFSSVFFVCGTIIIIIITGLFIMIGFGIVDLLEDYSDEKKRRNL